MCMCASLRQCVADAVEQPGAHTHTHMHTHRSMNTHTHTHMLPSGLGSSSMRRPSQDNALIPPSHPNTMGTGLSMDIDGRHIAHC